MLEELKDIYKENIEWLSFAELKNGALLTISGVLLGIINQYLEKDFIILYEYLCLLVIFICALSFVPYLNTNKFIVKNIRKECLKKGYKNCIEARNIIYYNCIFMSTKNDYIQALKDIILNDNQYAINKLEENYIDQIYQISTIASIKYYLFKLALIIFGIILIALMLTNLFIK